MTSSLRKLITLLVLFILAQQVTTQAQAWTAGVPMNQIIMPSFMVKSAAQLPGCFPDAAVTFNFVLPTVTGIQYYLKVTSIDPNSAYKLPTLDTLAVGDSIAVNGGSNSLSLYYFAASASSAFNADLYAAGTPTTAGQAYPCATVQLWMSNLMICNEGLSAQVQGNCTIMSGPTETANLVTNELSIVSPTLLNNHQLGIRGLVGRNTIHINSITGQPIKKVNAVNSTVIIDCSMLSDGIYILMVDGVAGKQSSRFVISH